MVEMNGRRKSIRSQIITAFSALIGFLFLIPIVWMCFAAFKNDTIAITSVREWFTPPFMLSNFKEVFVNSSLLVWIYNSFVTSGLMVILVPILSAMCAYALSKMEFRYKTFMYFFFLCGLMIPQESTIIPLFTIANQMHLINTLAGIVLPTLAVSLYIIIMKSFFDGLPKDFFESAEIDGASEYQKFLHIALPLSKPAMATIAIFSFVRSWNNFFWPLVCAMQKEKFTITVGIASYFTSNLALASKYGTQMAASVLASIPGIILFLIFEKNIVKGIAAGGIKG
jgi:ABC-type sugar transport system, permease component